jgi:hypothetical protein
MTKILDIFADKLDLSPDEHRDIKTWIVDLDVDRNTLNNITTMSGGGAAIAHGNVQIDFANGITLKNPSTGNRAIHLDPDGDAWFGKNIDSFTDTTFFIISNDQKYDGQTYEEGDLLVGSHRTGKANMWWDASTGKLYFRSGTTVAGTIGTGGIDFELGSIGGWNFNATTLYDDNNSIIMDSANEKITIGDGNSIIIDGANEIIKSENYSAGAAGFQISGANGDAEFNNITARGTFRTSVFQKDNIIATGGDLIVSRNAGEVRTDATTPASTGSNFDLHIKDDDSDVGIASTNDVLRIKGFNGSALIDVWVTVDGVTNFTGFSVYNCNLESGTSKTIESGMGVVNYGPSGAGILHLEAGSTTTRMRVATHAGSPWTTLTNQVVLGNLRGIYGTGANDRYGIGVGDYSGGNYMSYNAETSGKFIIKSGTGALSITGDGIAITDADDATSRISWFYDSSGNLQFMGNVYGNYQSGDDTATTWVNTVADTGASTPTDWTNAQSMLVGQNVTTNDMGRVTAHSDGYVFIEAQDNSVQRAYLEVKNTGYFWLYGSPDGVDIAYVYAPGNGSLTHLATDTITLNSANLIHLPNKGLYVGSTGTASQVDGDGVFTNDLNVRGGLRVGGTTKDTTVGDATIENDLQVKGGLGLGNVGKITTNGRMKVQEKIYVGDGVTIGSTSLGPPTNGLRVVGDAYTIAWVAWTAFAAGFSSVTESTYYKRFGNWVFISVDIYGTSNANTFTFTLPVTAETTPPQVFTVRRRDNGTYGIGTVYLNGSTCSVRRAAGTTTNNWATSGDKSVTFTCFYQAA